MAQQSVKVTVYGNEFSLRGDSAERTQRAASFVDAQMSLMHAKSPDQSTNTIAILAALNAAEQQIAAEETMREIATRMELLAEDLEKRIA